MFNLSLTISIGIKKMKVKYETVEKRRRSLLDIIKNAGTITTNELLERSDTSSVTVRRDLVFLEEHKCISRYHGGCSFSNDYDAFGSDKTTDSRELIAYKAAGLIEDGDIVFLNSSSTALLAMKYIIGKRVTIITNNARALNIDHDPLISLFFTGGEIRFPKEVMVGDMTVSALSKIIADKAIMGCSGLDVSTGITTANASEVSANQTMIKQTNGKVIIVADHAKLGRKHSFCSGPLSDIDILITDNEADSVICEGIAEHGVEIIKI